MTSSETHFSKAFAATDLCRDIETLFPELVTIRHTLHQHPEKGTQEFETDRIITGCLDAWGIPYRMIADTGILASLTGEGSDPVGNTVGLRADIDALPIEEDPSHACCSLNSGMMHACGHDAHTTIALGTARLLQLHRSEWSGTVKFFFQPAEETVGGAQRMVEQGCMKKETEHFAKEALTGEVEGIHGFWHENIFEAVYCTNLLMRSVDVLVTKPSELAFYPVPKLFIKRVGKHEMWGAIHSAEIGDGTLECRDIPHTLQMIDLFLKEDGLLFDMCDNIVKNKSIGIYDGAYKVVELAMGLKK